MEEELKMIEKSDTWEMVESPQYKQPIAVKWVYRTVKDPTLAREKTN